MVNRSIRETSLKKYRQLLEKWSLYLFSERGDLIWWIDQGQLFPEEAASQPQSVEYGLRCCCCCLPLCILSFWLWKAQVHQFGIQPVAEADFGWLTRGPQGDHPPVPNPEGCLSHHPRKQMVTVVGDQRETTSQIKAAQRYPLSSSFPCYLSCGAVRSMITKA